MVVGLVAPPGLTQALAEQVARRLPSMMRKKFPDVSWKVVLSVEPLAGAVGMNVDLIQLTRRRMHFDSSRSVAELGITPRPVRESIAASVSWFREAGWVEKAATPCGRGA